MGTRSEASFTKAAAKLHVAQPGVSAQIRNLERELGETLLDRTGRTVRPTEAGTAILPYARAALKAVAGARLAIDELTGLVHGHGAVGMVTSCLSLVDLPELLDAFHRHHPAVEIALAEANSDRLLDSLQDRQLDVAIVGHAGLPRAGIATHIAADEPLVAAVSRKDALAPRTAITLNALRDRRLLGLPHGTGLRASLDDACTKAGFQPRIAFEARPPRPRKVRRQGLGVAILPVSIAGACPSDLQAIMITRPGLRARLELAWKAEGPTSPASRALIQHTVSPCNNAGRRSLGGRVDNRARTAPQHRPGCG